jgi:hypothetical protein
MPVHLKLICYLDRLILGSIRTEDWQVSLDEVRGKSDPRRNYPSAHRLSDFSVIGEKYILNLGFLLGSFSALR